jgi:F0F1-type ATP synthase epsilon subunit
VVANKAKNKFHLRVIIPTETKVDEQVEIVIMRTISGDMVVLPGHGKKTTIEFEKNNNPYV